MPKLYLSLVEGFLGERAVVRVDGRVILDQPDVKTRPEYGMATVCETALDAGEHTVEVSLPGRGLARTARVNMALDTFMAFSAGAEGLGAPRVSNDPFIYG